MKMQLVGNTHLIAGGSEMIAAVLTVIEKGGIEIHGNPDIYIREYRHFGIENARDIRQKATARAFGDKRYFIIAAAVMTSEAQNALLKTLEEAPGDAMFFLIVPSPQTLLPTVLSRAQLLKLPGSDADTALDATKFLGASCAARLDMLKSLMDKDGDDKRDMSAIIRFLSALERKLATRMSAETREGVEAVYRARLYVSDKGALVKPLLEQVALLVPKMNSSQK